MASGRLKIQYETLKNQAFFPNESYEKFSTNAAIAMNSLVCQERMTMERNHNNKTIVQGISHTAQATLRK